MKFTPPSNPNSTVTPTIMGLSNPGTESSEVIYTPTIMSLGISEEEIVESFTLVPMGLNNPEFESKILFTPSSMDWADPNSNCIDCVPIFFNPIKTSCCDTPTTPSDGGQITWDDILDKPICFPACLTPLENIFVPLTRTITINGETHGLSSDQTWTVDVPSYLSVISPLLYDNTTGVFSIQVATTSQGGYLSSTDWNKFNAAYILRHNPVTIGTANGLSLSTQVLSLGLASTSTIGALSATDWNIFNNKQNALGYIPENVANKSISTSLGTSNVLYPTQLAV